ncbi:MAG: hypothetical protein ATN35_04360 [Epulopiscium sp. Nele67-Bin004]|nr:MAG: hypothetical protein ATN35_04360 [Epulopiscium sp. Nele67-Bin004]
MKLLNRRTSALGLGLLMGLGLASSPTLAKTGTENLSAIYNNIKVTFNNGYVTTVNEPFIVDGTTYVSLRDIANIFNVITEWDPTSQTVKLQGSMSNEEEMAYQLQVASLQTQLLAMQEKLNQYIENDIQAEEELEENALTLAELETLLENEFYNEHKIRWYFELDEKNRYIDMQIEFYGDDYGSRYAALDDDDIVDFIEDVLIFMVDEVTGTTMAGKEVRGDIVDLDNNENLVSFTLSSTGYLTYDIEYATVSLSDVASSIYTDVIRGIYDRWLPSVVTYDDLEFQLSIRDLYIEERNGFFTFFVVVDAANYIDDWNNLDTTYYSATRRLTRFMNDIADELADVFNLDVEDDIAGYIVAQYDHDEILLKYEEGDIDYRVIR